MFACRTFLHLMTPRIMKQESNMNLLKSMYAFALTCALLADIACQSPQAGELHQTTQTPDYLDIQSLIEGRATVQTSSLLKGLRTPTFDVIRSRDGYRVGSTRLSSEQGDRTGVLVVVAQGNGAFTALLEAPEQRGVVIGKPDGTQHFYPAPAEDLSQDDIVHSASDSTMFAQATATSSDTPQTVTILIGMSQATVEEYGDPMAYALALVEFVNRCLSNSKVENIRLSLAGVEIVQDNYPITSATLGKISTLFGNAVRADLVSGIFVRQPESGTTMGLAYRPGRYSIVQGGGVVLGHEIGHNVDGGHCNQGEDDFRFGQKVGYMNYDSTLLCRDAAGAPFYSTPDVTTSSGKPYGNAKTANMARQWREKGHMLTDYSTNDAPTIPFLMRNGSFTNFCISAKTLTDGARVAIDLCDGRNVSQRWIEWNRDGQQLLRLAAAPHLCIAKETSASTTAVLRKCSTAVANQFWTRINGQIVNGLDGKGGMLTALYSSQTKHQLAVTTTDNNLESQWQTEKAPVLLSNLGSNYCISLNGQPQYGAGVVLASCVKESKNQQWVVEDTGNIRSVANQGLCLGLGGNSVDVVLRNCPAMEENVWSGPKNLILNTKQQKCIGTRNAAKDKEPVVLVSCENTANNGWIALP